MSVEMAYTHRNGETEAPTEPGKYWFSGDLDHRFVAAKDLTEVVDSLDGLLAWHKYYSCYKDIGTFRGQWWGPIVPPWEGKQ